jgi:mannose-6-phosphate isomerase-like protein (cupin superfamily)
MSTEATRAPVHWGDVEYRIVLSSSESKGKLGLFESLTPVGGGPPRHVHHNEDEAFYVRSGKLKFWIDGHTTICGPGDAAFAPRGVEHAFRVIGGEPAQMLTTLTPGGMEAFFVEMAKGDYRLPDAIAQVAEIAGRYGLKFTGPPLAD